MRKRFTRNNKLGRTRIPTDVHLQVFGYAS